MDRIGGLGAPQPFLPRKEDPSTKKGRKSAETAKTGFLSFLGRSEAPAAESPVGPAADSEAALESLLDDVYTLGQDLARNPSPENIEIGRAHV